MDEGLGLIEHAVVSGVSDLGLKSFALVAVRRVGPACQYQGWAFLWPAEELPELIPADRHRADSVTQGGQGQQGIKSLSFHVHGSAEWRPRAYQMGSRR